MNKIKRTYIKSIQSLMEKTTETATHSHTNQGLDSFASVLIAFWQTCYRCCSSTYSFYKIPFSAQITLQIIRLRVCTMLVWAGGGGYNTCGCDFLYMMSNAQELFIFIAFIMRVLGEIWSTLERANIGTIRTPYKWYITLITVSLPRENSIFGTWYCCQ